MVTVSWQTLGCARKVSSTVSPPPPSAGRQITSHPRWLHEHNHTPITHTSTWSTHLERLDSSWNVGHFWKRDYDSVPQRIIFIISPMNDNRSYKSWTMARQWTGGLWESWCMKWWRDSRHSRLTMKMIFLSPSCTMTSFIPSGSARRPCPFSKRSVCRGAYGRILAAL